MAGHSTATVGSILSATAAALSEAGCPSPQADAEQLVMHAGGLSRTDMIFARRDPVGPGDPLLTELPPLVARRAAREPLQHILGTAPMGRLDLAVGPGVFVPRPETELVAQWCVDELGKDLLDDAPDRRKAPQPTGAGPVVVDLCTGSGALALAIADQIPAASVTGVELDPVALDWARRNLATCREMWAGERGARKGEVRLVGGDVTDPALVGEASMLADLRGRADLVVSNPPYVPLATDVDAEVRHDPHHAVFGGDDGLDVIRPMMNTVRALLKPGGIVAIEHDDDSGADMTALLAGTGIFHGIEVHRDLAGRDRFTTARRRSTDEGTDQAT
ncbi:peptide chain release factor N(5)-glutamine methyltransferase [Corynebacterium sp. NPDC060344]|uniref:peptide chain release factor N(5)-glutamine methyltransferase n=1 Tax=Corynebacterium sp. NPDC060344 TaxID=3347101 RepID=UPI003658FD6B